jgi:hypothetical protein
MSDYEKKYPKIILPPIKLVEPYVPPHRRHLLEERKKLKLKQELEDKTK